MKPPKAPKIIKAHFNQPLPAKAELPKIPDLVLNFASDTKIYTLWVPSCDMGKVATMFCDMMDKAGIVFKLEEKSR